MQMQAFQTIRCASVLVLRTESYYKEIWYLCSGAGSGDNPALVPKHLLFHLKAALPRCIIGFHVFRDQKYVFLFTLMKKDELCK